MVTYTCNPTRGLQTQIQPGLYSKFKDKVSYVKTLFQKLINKCFLCEYIHLLKTMMHLSLGYSTDHQGVFRDWLLWHMSIN